MEPLFIEGQLKFPKFDFNSKTGVLKIIGRSIPENPVKLYDPIISWVHNYVESEPENITLSVYLEYLNTHSTECFLILLKRIVDYSNISTKKAKIVWYFDEYDEDMLALGKDFSSLVDFPFEYKELADV